MADTHSHSPQRSANAPSVPYPPSQLFYLGGASPSDTVRHLKCWFLAASSPYGTVSVRRWHAHGAISQASKAHIWKLIYIHTSSSSLPNTHIFPLPVRSLSAVGNLSGLHLLLLFPNWWPSWMNINMTQLFLWNRRNLVLFTVPLWQNTDLSFTLFKRCDANSSCGFNYISAARESQLCFLCLFWPQKASSKQAEHSLISPTVAKSGLGPNKRNYSFTHFCPIRSLQWYRCMCVCICILDKCNCIIA